MSFVYNRGARIKFNLRILYPSSIMFVTIICLSGLLSFRHSNLVADIVGIFAFVGLEYLLSREDHWAFVNKCRFVYRVYFPFFFYVAVFMLVERFVGGSMLSIAIRSFIADCIFNLIVILCCTKFYVYGE